MHNQVTARTSETQRLERLQSSSSVNFKLYKKREVGYWPGLLPVPASRVETLQWVDLPFSNNFEIQLLKIKQLNPFNLYSQGKSRHNKSPQSPSPVGPWNDLGRDPRSRGNTEGCRCMLLVGAEHCPFRWNSFLLDYRAEFWFKLHMLC